MLSCIVPPKQNKQTYAQSLSYNQIYLYETIRPLLNLDPSLQDNSANRICIFLILHRIWIFALLYLRIYPLLDFASYSCYAFPVDPPSSLDFVKVLCSSLRMYPTT